MARVPRLGKNSEHLVGTNCIPTIRWCLQVSCDATIRLWYRRWQCLFTRIICLRLQLPKWRPEHPGASTCVNATIWTRRRKARSRTARRKEQQPAQTRSKSKRKVWTRVQAQGAESTTKRKKKVATGASTSAIARVLGLEVGSWRRWRQVMHPKRHWHVQHRIQILASTQVLSLGCSGLEVGS